MAGHNKPTLHMDPALVKYQSMFTNRHANFRWTGRTVWISICYAMLVPAAFGYVAYTTDGKYEMRGKRRGDTIREF